MASAASVAVDAVRSSEAVYPEGHPRRPLLRLTAGKILLAVNDPAAAADHLELAVSGLRVTHGGESRLLRAARTLLRRAKRRRDDGDSSDTDQSRGPPGEEDLGWSYLLSAESCIRRTQHRGFSLSMRQLPLHSGAHTDRGSTRLSSPAGHTGRR